MASIVYCLCALASGVCALLLTRAYWRTRERLLLWSSLCFALLTASNLLLIVDLAILPTQIDLSIARTVPALIGTSLMLAGLIWESRS